MKNFNERPEEEIGGPAQKTFFVVDRIGALVTMEGAVKSGGRNLTPKSLGIVRDAAMVVNRGKIVWTGKRQDVPLKFRKLWRVFADGKLVMPGMVDSHTHLIFAGDRSAEFEMRLAGRTYSEIAEKGGGIVNTMNATRRVSKDVLVETAAKRMKHFVTQGVTTVEIKTGYGLSFEAEQKCLDAIQSLTKRTPATLKSTFLGAHAVPPEFKGRKKEYIEAVAYQWLPELSRKCDFVDLFLDAGYFDADDAKILLSEAQKYSLPVKLHADELELTGGTETAVKYNALSADHLLKIGDAQIKLLAENETTATLLPTTAFFLKTGYAPARKLLEAGARVALATDFNPGTSPTQDISLVGLLAALEMGMRTEEIVTALTLNGAYALGLQKSKGALIEGYDADFVMFDAESPAKLFYEFGYGTRNVQVFCAGQPVEEEPPFKIERRAVPRKPVG